MPIHNQVHAVASTDDHSATASRLLYSDGSGEIQELDSSADGRKCLKSTGASSAPVWDFLPGSIYEEIEGALEGDFAAYSDGDSGILKDGSNYYEWYKTADAVFTIQLTAVPA